MATPTSVLAWRILGTVEPGGLPSMGSHRVGHDWSDLAAAAAWLVILNILQFSSVQFSHSVPFDSLRPHGLQHARPPCPSPTPRVYSNSCPLSWWCHLTISSSVIPFSSCLQSFPASGSFPMSQLFALGGQSIEDSAAVLLINIWGWFPLGFIGLISLLSKGLLTVFSSTTVQKHQFFGTQPSLSIIFTKV